MPKCPKECGKCNPFIFRKTVIPAQVADDTVTPPKIGAYCNALVVYEATGNAYLFSSDGIPTLLSATDYELLANLPSINGVTVVGDLTLEDLGIAQLVEAEAETRAGADTYLQEQIDAITLSSDVVDIVGTYQELEDYDTSHLSENDIIKVLADETVGGATTYYRWVNNSWEYIGEEGPYYTKSQTDALLDEKLDADALDDYYDKDEVDDLLDDKADVSALADKQDKLIAGSNITIDQATNVISATVPSLDNYYTKSETYSQNEVDGLISGVEAQIPTSTSQLVNDSGFLTSIPIASANDLGGIKVGSGLSIDASGVLSATAPSITVDSSLSTTSTNPVQNKVITSALNNKADISDIPVVPSNISAFYNDVGYVTSATVAQNYYNKTETYTQNEVDGLISGVEAQIPTKTSDIANDGSDGTSTYVEADELATVATSGSYNDLLNKPTIYDPEDYYWANVKISDTSSLDTKPTFNQVKFNGVSHPHLSASGTLTFSADGDWSAGNHGNVVLQTTSFRPSSNQSGAMDLGAAAGTGIWRNLYLSGGIYHGTYLLTLPDKAGTVALLSDLPTVNNATLTIQENGSTVGTFTANASSNVTANITVPTKTSDLTNDSGFITASDEQQCEDGASISIDNPNSSPVPLSSVELLGNTTQDTLSGKNLWKTPASKSASGITLTLNANGTYDISGTASAEVNTAIDMDISFFSDGATYTFSTNKTIPSGLKFYAEVYNGSTWVRHILGNGAYLSSTKQTITASSNLASGTKIKMTVRVDNGTTLSVSGIGVQLEKSSSATDFEPYCGGIPAPNPTYPIAVQTTTGEQVVKTMGKNLLKLGIPSANDRKGLTVVANDSTGELTFSGTTTNSWPWLVDTGSVKYPAGTYIITIDRTLPYAFAYRFYRQDGTYAGGSIVAGATAVTATIDFTPVKIAILYGAPSSGTTIASTTVKPMFELGSTASDFEPYQSQSYEVNLGKNLFDKDNANVLTAYIRNGDYQIIDGSSNNDKTIYIPCEPNTTYTVSKGLAGTTSKNRFRVGTMSTVPAIGDTVSQCWVGADGTTTTSYTITTNSSAKYLVAFIYTNDTAQTFEEMLATIQIEKGSQATSYSSYFTPIELCKLGDYQDKIYKSGDDWFVHREVGKYVLTSDVAITPQIYTDSANTARFQFTNILNEPNSSVGRSSLKCSHFEYKSNWGADVVGIQLPDYADESQNTRFWFRVPKTIATTFNELKTFLTNNPISLYYSLATPVEEQITNSDLIDQLNALKAASLYAGENNIMLIPAGGAQGTLDLCFYSSTLPVATSGSLGAVAVGDGLSITDAGVLSVDPPVPTKVSELTNDSGFVTGSIVKANGSNLGTTTIDSTTASYMEVTKLTTATDLDTLQTTGIYIVGASGNTNAPTSNWGTIFVDWTVGTHYQLYIPDGDNTTIYKRKYSSGTWGSWAPIVNNGTLTIQKNGTNVQTFTANQSSNATANITVPTKVSDLTSDVGGNSFYGTCTTAAATAAKEVTVSSDQNFVLKTGVMVTFSLPASNTAQNPTINVNNTGAKQVKYNSTVITTSNLNRVGYSTRPTTFVYDGTYWVWVSWSVDDNTAYSTMSVAEGKTGTATSARTMRADYLKQIIDYHIRTADNLSPADDTTAKWKTALGSVNGSYYTWYSTAGKFTHQPSAYGFLETFIQGSDIYQRWHTQLSGPILYRSGNNSGWSDPSDGSWNTVATTANIPTNLSDLYNDMGFASYSAGDHIDITNDVISAVDYVHSENPVTVTGSTPTVTSGMIADGAITASKLAAGVNLTLILSTTDIGEGAALAANTLYGVYQ